MEIIEDNGSSSSSSSTSSLSSQTETRKSCAQTSTNHAKGKAGRKKFKETRHPVYRGIRLRNKSNWVCEIREPNKKSKIWLGTFQTPEMAARAYDEATLTLHGDDPPLSFTDSARLIRRAKSCSPHDIQEAALEATYAFGQKLYNKKPCSSLSIMREDEDDETSFVDEEVLFNMPSFYNSMAEGLVITPPGMKRGFDWSDDVDCNMDLTLWRY